MPTVKLASQRMNTGGSPGRISPVLIDGRVGASARAPRVNVNAGNVRYSNMDAGQIIPDTRLKSAAEAGMRMTKSAFDYQDRVDQADAAQRLLTYEDRLNAILRGENGYLLSSGQDAVNTYASRAAEIKAAGASVMDDAPSAVKAKMALKVHSMASNATSDSSVHKAQQQTVWENNIQENRMANGRAEMLQASNEPEKFNAHLVETLDSLDEFYSGQPELARKAKRAATADAYLSAAAQQSDLNNFTLAAEYVMSGVDSGVDPVKTASALKGIERAMWTRNARIEAQSRSRAADFKAKEENFRHNVLRQAMNTGNRDTLGQISDPIVQIKYEKLFDDFALGRPSDAGATAVLADFSQTSLANPDDILTHEFPIYVSGKDRSAAHTRLLSDRKANITNQRSEAKNFVDQVIQAPTGVMGVSYEEIKATKDPAMLSEYQVLVDAGNNQAAYWNSQFNQALEDSKRNPDESAEDAVVRVKYEMMESLENQGLSGQNVSRVKIPAASLKAIPGLPFETGGMIQYVRAEEPISREGVDIAFQDANLDIMSKYGIDPANLEGSMAALASDPVVRQNLKRDIFQLRLQKQFLIQRSYTSGTSNAE